MLVVAEVEVGVEEVRLSEGVAAAEEEGAEVGEGGVPWSSIFVVSKSECGIS